MNPSSQALTEIEERLGQPGGAQVLQDLRQALTEDAQALRRSMSSGTLDRTGSRRSAPTPRRSRPPTRFWAL